MRYNTKDLKPKINALAIYQIVGGIIGLGSIAYLIATTNPLSLILLLIIIFAVGLFGYSIFCGIKLFKQPLVGLEYSKINQLLQVVHFAISGYAFQYISGAHFSITLDVTESLNFKFNLSLSTWQININTGEPYMLISLNLVALFLIVFIDKMITRFKAEILDEQLVLLGQNESAKQLT